MLIDIEDGDVTDGRQRSLCVGRSRTDDWGWVRVSGSAENIRGWLTAVSGASGHAILRVDGGEGGGVWKTEIRARG